MFWNIGVDIFFCSSSVSSLENMCAVALFLCLLPFRFLGVGANAREICIVLCTVHVSQGIKMEMYSIWEDDASCIISLLSFSDAAGPGYLAFLALKLKTKDSYSFHERKSREIFSAHPRFINLHVTTLWEEKCYCWWYCIMEQFWKGQQPYVLLFSK